MNSFIENMKKVDEEVILPENTEVIEAPLTAIFLPYYVDPNSLQLMVLLQSSTMPGAYTRTGRKLGLSCISLELPEDEQITVEDAFTKFNIKANIQNAIPFGSIMKFPKTSRDANEMVLVHIDPPEITAGMEVKADNIDGVLGAISFDELLGVIKENFVQDVGTRLILSELYIMAMEEATKSETSEEQFGSQNQNAYAGLLSPDENQSSVSKTSDISDEIIKTNSQNDFGSIYSKK